jgi:hypothetical protein
MELKKNSDEHVSEFVLFDGPLQDLGRRLGLVRGTNTFGLGVALGLTTWAVLFVLALLQGSFDKFFSMAVLGVHVRLLLAVPLLFLCETWVAPRMADFVRNLVGTGVVTEKDKPALAAIIRRIGRLSDPWLAEVFFLLLAFGIPLSEWVFGVQALPGQSGSVATLLTETGGHFGPVLGWYLLFCLPLFRFLILRWLWHLVLWCYFLWRVQKLDLQLIPTHPDQTAGLGYLEVVHEHFVPLAAAVSMVYSACFAENITSGAMPFETLTLLIPLVFLAVAVLFVGPLFIFSSKLWCCRINGWSAYMGMASRYVNTFDRKWIQGENPAAEPLLGTPDMQSLADLNNSVNIVRELRWIPAGKRLLFSLAAAVIVPLLPLLLLKYPLAELAAKLFQNLSGL